MSTALSACDKVGAVSAAHLILEFHVIALGVEPWIIRNVAADTFPDAAGLVKDTVVASVRSWLKLLAVLRFSDTTLELEVTAAYSSLKPLSSVMTPFASAVTALLAAVRPRVAMSK